MDPVADHGSDAETPHLARGIGDDSKLVVQHHAEAAVGQDLVDHAFDREQFFLGQARSPFTRMARRGNAAGRLGSMKGKGWAEKPSGSVAGDVSNADIGSLSWIINPVAAETNGMTATANSVA